MHKIAPALFGCLLLTAEARAQSPETIRDILSRVVLVTAQDANGKPLAMGSGFVIDAEGRIASNLHVIAGASSATVRLVNQTEKYAVRTLSAFSAERDLVILRIDKSSPPVALGDSSRLQIGDRVLAFGNPAGLVGTVSEGIVSAYRTLDGETRLIQITAAISPGSSGGPVIDSRGRVVGLASASMLSGQNLNFAIPVEYLKTLISKGFREVPMSVVQGHAGVSATSPLSPGKSSARVKVLDFHLVRSSFSANSDFTDVRFSVQNNLDRDIRNVHILVVWKRDAEKLSYSEYLVQQTIPANQADQVEKRDKGGVARFLMGREFSYEARILDYEIVHSKSTAESGPEPSPLTAPRKDPCPSGEYWDSANRRCMSYR